MKIDFDDKDRDAALGLLNRLVVAIEKVSKDLDKKEIVISLRSKYGK